MESKKLEEQFEDFAKNEVPTRWQNPAVKHAFYKGVLAVYDKLVSVGDDRDGVFLVMDQVSDEVNEYLMELQSDGCNEDGGD